MKNFFELKGKIINEIHLSNEETVYVTFVLNSARCRLQHARYCCESVRFVKIIGDLSAILGETITLAQDDHPQDPSWWKEELSESHTWSQFILEAAGHRVEFWFLGESNGFYGESVNFETIQ